MDHRTNLPDRRSRSLPRTPQLRRGTGLFLREAVRDMRTTGAVAPSGKALAGLLAAPLAERPGQSLDVLEAGAGTGSVTRVLLARLSRGSRLDVVEANPRFAARLARLAETGQTGETGEGRETGETEKTPQTPETPETGEPPERIRVHETLVERLETGRRYDVIVSGLPLKNFPPEQVELIMRRYLDLLRPGGVLTWFTYRGTGPARALLASRAEARRHRAVEQVLAGYQNRYATWSRTAWSNLPPATVWQLRVPSGPPAAPTLSSGEAVR